MQLATYALLLLTCWQNVPPAQQPATQPAPQTPAQQPPQPMSGEESLRALRDVPITQLLADAEDLLLRGSVQSALGAFKVILEKDPVNLDAKLGIARVAEAMRDFDSARTMYLEASKIDPTDYRVNHGLGRAYLQVRYWRQALHYLELAEKVAPTDQQAQIKVELSAAYRGIGSRNRAIEKAQEAVDLDARNYAAREALVQARIDSQQFAQARDDADALVRIAKQDLAADPTQSDNVQKVMGALQMKFTVLYNHQVAFYVKDPAGNPTETLLAGREAEAAQALTELVNVMVEQAEVRRVLGLYQPIMLAVKGVEYDPRNAGLWMTLGKLYVQTLQAQQAIDAFRKVLEIDPANAEAAEQIRLLGADPAAPPPAVTPAEAPAKTPADAPKPVSP